MDQVNLLNTRVAVAQPERDVAAGLAATSARNVPVAPAPTTSP